MIPCGFVTFTGEIRDGKFHFSFCAVQALTKGLKQNPMNNGIKAILT